MSPFPRSAEVLIFFWKFWNILAKCVQTVWCGCWCEAKAGRNVHALWTTIKIWGFVRKCVPTSSCSHCPSVCWQSGWQRWEQTFLNGSPLQATALLTPSLLDPSVSCSAGAASQQQSGVTAGVLQWLSRSKIILKMLSARAAAQPTMKCLTLPSRKPLLPDPACAQQKHSRMEE